MTNIAQRGLISTVYTICDDELYYSLALVVVSIWAFVFGLLVAQLVPFIV